MEQKAIKRPSGRAQSSVTRKISQVTPKPSSSRCVTVSQFIGRGVPFLCGMRRENGEKRSGRAAPSGGWENAGRLAVSAAAAFCLRPCPRAKAPVAGLAAPCRTGSARGPCALREPRGLTKERCYWLASSAAARSYFSAMACRVPSAISASMTSSACFTKLLPTRKPMAYSSTASSMPSMMARSA